MSIGKIDVAIDPPEVRLPSDNAPRLQNPVETTTVSPEQLRQMGYTVQHPTVPEIADGIAKGRSLAQIAVEHAVDLAVVIGRAAKYKERIEKLSGVAITDEQVVEAWAIRKRQIEVDARFGIRAVERKQETVEPAIREEEKPVQKTRRGRPMRWPSRAQIEEALRQSTRVAEVASILKVNKMRLREIFENAGMEYPWRRGKAFSPANTPATETRTTAATQARVPMQETAAAAPVKQSTTAPVTKVVAPAAAPVMPDDEPEHPMTQIEQMLRDEQKQRVVFEARMTDLTPIDAAKVFDQAINTLDLVREGQVVTVTATVEVRCDG